MEFLMSETKVYAILTAGYDRKERMEGRILGEELELEVFLKYLGKLNHL